MTKARILANLISDNAELADGQISVAEVVGAAPLASPSFTGNLTVDTDTLYVNAGDNQVSVGSSSGYQQLNVNGNIAVGGAGNKGIYFGDNITSSADQEWLLANNASSSNAFTLYEYDSGTYINTRMLFASGGDTNFYNANNYTFTINQDGLSSDFRVETSANTHALFVDAGANAVHINGSTDVDDHPLVVHAGTNANAIAIRGRSDDIGEISFFENDATTKLGSLQFRPTFARLDQRASGGRVRIQVGPGLNQIADFYEIGPVFNEGGGSTVDFRVESNNNTHMLFVDAGSDHVNIGTTTDYGSVLNVFTTGTDALEIVSDNGNANAGPYLDITRKSGSPADGDFTGAIRFLANSDAAETIVASINTVFDDVSNASEDSSLFFKIRQAGAQPNVMDFSPTITVFNNDAYDRDFRIETGTNTHMFFVDAGENSVVINNSVPKGNGTNNSSFVTTSTVSNGSTEAPFFVGYSGTGIGDGFIMTSTDQTSFLTAASFNDYPDDYETRLVIRVHPTSTPGNYVESMRFGNSEVVVNEQSRNCDFRVEGNNVSNGIVYDADDETVCFFTNTTSSSVPSGINFKRDGQNNGWQNIGHTTAAVSGFSYIQFLYNSSRIGQAVQSGTTGVTYQTTSDYRLKENAVAITSATERVKQLNPIRFNFISEPDRTIDGFLAHEVQAIVPEAVSGTKDEVDDNGNPEYQGLDTSRLVPVLVATIKELEARITALENA
jgi:hypothetical protein